MANFSFQFGSSGKNSRAATWLGGIVACLFATPFAAFGLFAIWSGIKKLSAGETGQGVGISLFGLVFAAVGFGIMYAAVTASRRQRLAEEKWNAQTDGGKKVWLARDDWAAGKIKSSTTAQVRIIFIVALAFCSFGTAMSFFVLPGELHGGNYKALAILLFPAIGIGCGIAVIKGILARKRFGDCTFELAQVPAPLGGSLDGLIQTGRPLRLEQGLHLKLSCISRTVTSSGDGQHVSENIIWQSEKVFRPDASLPTTGAGGSGIPVHFNLPANQPESSLRGSSTIVWRLEAKAKMAGPDFTAMFEVPVFRVAGTVPSPDNDSDPTASLQMSAEEIRRDEHSKIQVTDGPNGREFYFPAARNPVPAIITSAFGLLSATGCGALIINHVSYFAAAIVGLFAVIFGSFGINLLFKSSLVTVNSSEVTLQNHWLFFTRTRRFDAGDIVRFDIKVGMTSGTKAFHDLKLVTRASEDNFAVRKARYQQTGERPPLKFEVKDPAGVTLAGGLASKPEADWLVKAMSESLGR